MPTYRREMSTEAYIERVKDKFSFLVEDCGVT